MGCETIEGRVCGQQSCSSTLTSESQSVVHYRDEERLGPRPRREKSREDIADFVMLMLGGTMVRVELNRQHLSLAVDHALQVYEQHAPRKVFDWYYFQSVPGQSQYKLPCDVGIIRAVHFDQGRCGPGNMSYGTMLGDGSVMPFYASFFPGASPFPSTSAVGGYGFPAVGNLGEWVIFRGYQELFRRFLGGEPGWDYSPDNAIILYPNPTRSFTVAVHYLQRKRDWQEVDPWIKEYALAMAKQMLGRIRSKFDRFVSPSGGVVLDGQALLTEGAGEKEKLEAAIMERFQITHMLPIVG